MFISYITEKKNLADLARNNKTSISTIQRSLKILQIVESSKQNLKEIILLIDATYWSLNFGVVVFKDAISKSLFGGFL